MAAIDEVRDEESLITPQLYNPNKAHQQIEHTLIQYTWYYIQEIVVYTTLFYQ